MKVALVHDWLVARRGGEKVLEALCELFPQAEIFTLVHRRGASGPAIESHRIHTSFLQRIPGAVTAYRHFLPLMPAAIEAMRLPDFDLVISSSHCVAKGVRLPEGTRHLSYVHAPMRYMWDLFDDYFGPGKTSAPVRLAALAVRPALQHWDVRSARGVDRFVANSRHIAEQIQRLYGREATVVNPPVDLDRYTAEPLSARGEGDYFLWMGAFAPYKRLDLVLEAFRHTQAPLLIAGFGTDTPEFRAAASANVRFLGAVPDDALPRLYRDARALLFPGVEDFGITPLEGQASGCPVIAYGRGGALETVTPETGLFFDAQTVDALVDALRRFESWKKTFQPQAARDNALRFSRSVFLAKMCEEVDRVMLG
ncbi:MAG: glycosyltransferase [Myxococcaceae bacterium]